jgi:hypothetical protein
MNTLLTEVLPFALILGLVAYLAWLWHQRALRQTDVVRLFQEGRNLLLSRFDSPQALLDFADTPAGHALLAPPFPTREKWQGTEGLPLLQAGLVVLFLGFGYRASYYAAMNWRTAGVTVNEIDAFYKALKLWQWGQLFIWGGTALILCGLLAAGVARFAKQPAAVA